MILSVASSEKKPLCIVRTKFNIDQLRLIGRVVMVLFPGSGAGHPMKPHRLSLTHSLVLHYGLYKKMMVRLDLLYS